MTERKASMGDKVYRGDVIKFIRNNITLGTFMKRTVKTANEACWDLCDKLNYVPAIEENPEPHWIPVTERLPDMHDEVLVTARGEVSIAWLYVDGKWRSNDMPQPMFKDIIAWMPLPEPYKGVTT